MRIGGGEKKNWEGFRIQNQFISLTVFARVFMASLFACGILL